MRKTQNLLTASSDSKGPVERNTLKCDAYNREYIKYKFLSLARISSKTKSFFFLDIHLHLLLCRILWKAEVSDADITYLYFAHQHLCQSAKLSFCLLPHAIIQGKEESRGYVCWGKTIRAFRFIPSASLNDWKVVLLVSVDWENVVIRVTHNTNPCTHCCTSIQT